MILVADSGSSKTDWIITSVNADPIEFTTKGINPFFVSEKEIAKIIAQKTEIKNNLDKIDEVHFFGEGCTSPDKREIVSNALSTVLKNAFINVETDTLGSVYATCGDSKGFTCVLGTSSSVAFYDGAEVSASTHGLGFILGDEGSGSDLGKRLLTSFLYGRMPGALKRKFQAEYSLTKDLIITNVYQRQLPNLYLSSFSQFLSSNRGNPFVEELLDEAFQAFVDTNLAPYSYYQSYPCHFVGSVAYFFKDVLETVCLKNKLKLGKVLRQPVRDIAEFIIRQNEAV
ncbi:N-acetylglucosamine kinase [Pedobacter sp. SYSU D00535]|uniref:N-acetylglucosamine kinase n=1 Tax=Pedobacter sp. SYSU D00535 TaxID=2810308 RepID=UPI001F624CB4|nr:N-acetylglucosamine kinase [Pedobacter sp. SYSU D00535]